MPVHAHHTYKVPCINNTQHIQKPAPPAGQPPSRQAETRRGARNGEGQTEQGRGKAPQLIKEPKKGEQHTEKVRQNEREKPKSINLVARDPPPPRPRTRSWGGGSCLLSPLRDRERFTALVTVGSRSRVPLFPGKYIQRRSRVSTRVREIALMILTLFGHYHIAV